MKDPMKEARKEATKGGIGNPKSRDLESDRKASQKIWVGKDKGK